MKYVKIFEDFLNGIDKTGDRPYKMFEEYGDPNAILALFPDTRYNEYKEQFDELARQLNHMILSHLTQIETLNALTLVSKYDDMYDSIKEANQHCRDQYVQAFVFGNESTVWAEYGIEGSQNIPKWDLFIKMTQVKTFKGQAGAAGIGATSEIIRESISNTYDYIAATFVQHQNDVYNKSYKRMLKSIERVLSSESDVNRILKELKSKSPFIKDMSDYMVTLRTHSPEDKKKMREKITEVKNLVSSIVSGKNTSEYQERPGLFDVSQYVPGAFKDPELANKAKQTMSSSLAAIHDIRAKVDPGKFVTSVKSLPASNMSKEDFIASQRKAIDANKLALKPANPDILNK